MMPYHLEHQIDHQLEQRRHEAQLHSLLPRLRPSRWIARLLRTVADRLEPVPGPLPRTA